MHKDWSRMAHELNTLVSNLRGRQPDVMRAFSQQAQAALKPAAIDTKTKELIALAVGRDTLRPLYNVPREGGSGCRGDR